MNDNNAAENLPPEAPQEAAPANPEARIAELEAQLAELKNESLRYLADAENTRRRAAKEKEDTSKYATAKFARDLLDVADNLQRALGAVKPEMMGDNPALKNLLTGVEATERQLAAVFERAGIQKIEPLGQPFDPNHHSVVNEIETAEYAPGTVAQVLQTGYMIHGRLLREAMVAVARGGAQPQAPHSVDQKV
jgi:molecular chaperone GrpE